MITRDGVTYAYTRPELGGRLVEVVVPQLTCPVRGCGQELRLNRELHQDGTGDVAWEFVDRKHTFFYHPNRRELVRTS